MEKIEHIKITILFLVRGNFEIYFKTKTRQKKKKKNKPSNSIQCHSDFSVCKIRGHLVRKQLTDRNHPSHYCFVTRSYYVMKETILLLLAHDVSTFDFSCNLSSIELILILWGKLHILQGEFYRTNLNLCFISCPSSPQTLVYSSQ